MMIMMMKNKTSTTKNHKNSSINVEDDHDDQVTDDDQHDEMTITTTEEKKKKRFTNTGRRFPAGGSSSGGDRGGMITCQAEKCTSDLSVAKRYHRRHKVCEFHAKAPSVLVSGLRQRFCQQCSRFHGLSEFDETKRSCRRRLAGHNERRRKSSSDPQGESGSSTQTEGSNPQLRAGDHGRTANNSQISYAGNDNNNNNGTSTYKHLQIR